MNPRILLWWEKLLGHWCSKHGTRKVKLYISLERLRAHEWICGYCEVERTNQKMEALKEGVLIPGMKYFP